MLVPLGLIQHREAAATFILAVLALFVGETWRSKPKQ